MREVVGSVNFDCRRIGSGCPTQLSELENAVYQWLIEPRKKKLVLKYSHIESYAKRKANQMQLDVSNFKFSHGWINKFCKRFHISSRCKAHQAQESLYTPAENIRIVSDFLAKVKHIHLDFEPRCVTNMDETPVYIDVPHNRTMHPVGDKTIDMVTSGHEKTRLTVTIPYLLMVASGLPF